MEAFDKKQSQMHVNPEQETQNLKHKITDAANELLNEGKKIASDLYEESKHKYSEAEEQIKAYSDQVEQKIKEKPLASILVAAGVGFLLSKLLRK